MSLPYGVDPNNLAETGWGVIFAENEGPAVAEALQPLLDHRREQAGARFRQLTYQPGESIENFLWYRYGETPGVLDLDVLPFYLLLVGSPEAIPFEIQQQLSVSHGVGRVSFGSVEDYASYAKAVVAWELGAPTSSSKMRFFCPDNGDSVGSLMRRAFVVPLLERDYTGLRPTWEVEALIGANATKSALTNSLGAETRPGLLFVAAHGRSLAPGHPEQETRQGALLCHVGLSMPDRPLQDQYFEAVDVPEQACLNGMICVLFAGFSAGTPARDSFPQESGLQDRESRALALQPFVARLPQILLQRGAQAVVGYLDRNWTLSFAWPTAGAYSSGNRETWGAFYELLVKLAAGERLGSAFRALSERATALAAELATRLEQQNSGLDVDDTLINLLRTATSDARNLVILGDPAVRLKVAPVDLLSEFAGLIPEALDEVAQRFGLSLLELLAAARAIQPRETGGDSGIEAPRGEEESARDTNRAGSSAGPGEKATSLLGEEPAAAEVEPFFKAGATKKREYLPLVAPRLPLVFLSYAREDRAAVREIREGLTQRDISVWMDEEDLRMGDDWAHKIASTLEEVDFAIVCLSSRSLKKEGFVQAEFRMIRDRQRNMPPGRQFVMPLRLEDCKVPKGLGFEAYTWRDFFTNPEETLDRIRDDINDHFKEHQS